MSKQIPKESHFEPNNTEPLGNTLLRGKTVFQCKIVSKL